MSYYPIPRINTPHGPRYHMFLLTLLEHAGWRSNDRITADLAVSEVNAAVADQCRAVWGDRKAYAESGKTYREICAYHPDLQEAWDELAESRKGWRKSNAQHQLERIERIKARVNKAAETMTSA